MGVPSGSDTVPEPPPTRPVSWPLWRRLLADLYPAVPARPLTVPVILWGGLGLLAATVVCLLRTGGPGALDTIWIEDAITFLNDAYHKPFGEVIFHPESGYFQFLPKILAEVAGAVPVGAASATLAIQAAVVTGSIAVLAFVASRPFLPQVWLRLLVAVPVVVMPVGHTQSDNDVATLHFPMLYALFWVLLWQPRTRVGQVVALVFATLAATCSILAVAFVPLALLRWVALRSWADRAVPAAYLAGMVLQVGGIIVGVSARAAGPGHYDPLWALKEYVITALPRSVLGESWLGGPRVDAGGLPTPLYGTYTPGEVTLVVLSILVVAALVTVGLLGMTRPHWPLAAVAGGYSVAIFCESVMGMGIVEPRYVIPAALLLYVAVAALLRPADGHRRRVSWVALASVSMLLAVVCAANYRVENGRSTSPRWSAAIDEATIYCRQWDPSSPFYFYGYQWWSIRIPCDRLR